MSSKSTNVVDQRLVVYDVIQLELELSHYHQSDQKGFVMSLVLRHIPKVCYDVIDGSFGIRGVMTSFILYHD